MKNLHDDHTRYCQRLVSQADAARGGPHCDHDALSRPNMEEPHAPFRSEGSRNTGRIVPVDNTSKSRNAQFVQVLTSLDAHPTPSHLLRHSRRRTAPEKRVENPIARLG